MGPIPVRISEIFGLVNQYISFKGALDSFQLMHIKIAMKIGGNGRLD